MVARLPGTSANMNDPMTYDISSILTVEKYCPSFAISFAKDGGATIIIANPNPSSRMTTLSGIFYENYIADELRSKGIKLFYWKGKVLMI